MGLGFACASPFLIPRPSGISAPAIASPLEGEVDGALAGGWGGDGAAFSLSADLRDHTPHPALRADLPLKGSVA